MKKHNSNLSDVDYKKLSEKMILASSLLIIGNKTFTDSEKIKYLSILFSNNKKK